VDEADWLAGRFEAHRPRLRAVAHRMLGSAAEADDAMREAWLRLSRSGADGVENMGGWLTTIVARVCLDLLRARQSRREEPISEQLAEQAGAADTDPERQTLIADSVGLALLVVLDTLTPAERLAFVLHDMFDVPSTRSRRSSSAPPPRRDSSPAEPGAGSARRARTRAVTRPGSGRS
jgi:RNA polymerase sigma factor (sigma-70 family)